MSWGFRDARRTERRRRRVAVLKFFSVLAGMLALGAIAYQSGAELVRVELAALGEETRRLNATITTLNGRIAELEQARQAAAAREAEANARYQRDVPTGTTREIQQLLQARIGEGVPAERLRFLITTATPGNKCENRPVTRRFQVRTPQNRGGVAAVSFEGTTVTADGEAAQSEAGAPQAWFDPARPLTIAFTQLGGARSEARGTLPLHHSVVRGDAEWRFTAAEADLRGFITVTADKCEYP
jgi:outer membrane murein-binding lipoprotein Lpp